MSGVRHCGAGLRFREPDREHGGRSGTWQRDKTSPSLNNDCLGAALARRGPSLIGGEHLLRRPRWASSLLSGRSSRTSLTFARRTQVEPSPGDRRSNPFLIARGFSDREHYVPPLTVGEPTVKNWCCWTTTRRHASTRAMMRIPPGNFGPGPASQPSVAVISAAGISRSPGTDLRR